MWVVAHLCVCLLGGVWAEGRPEVVKIGAIFSFGSINGRVSKIAMEAAVEDVNSDPTILGTTKLVLSKHDSNYSGYLGIVGGLRYMETGFISLIGPQTSGMAHILSQLANELHVPMLSFTALDPSLSSLQYPYFIQTAPNDLFQMTALSDMISYFGYRDIVAIYTDDEQSRGTITALGDKLHERRCRISYKAVLPPEALASQEEITGELVKIRSMGSRVIVVHSYAVIGRMVFRLADELGMMKSGYVWIGTSWLSTVLDSEAFSAENIRVFQGVLTLRPHTPGSEKRNGFTSRWNNLSNGSVGLNPYGLYAYDAVWVIARALKALLDGNEAISFSGYTNLNGLNGGILKLDSLSRFDQGRQLLDNILQINTTGLTGRIAFDSSKHVLYPSFDILNVDGRNYKQIGYWSNYAGLSVEPPEALYAKRSYRSSSDQRLLDVVWPGGTKTRPRGWVFPRNGQQLRIGVPKRISYKAFVSKDESTNEIRGYCIDVFHAAVSLLPYAVPHEFILFGDGLKNPSYTDLVSKITANVFDGAVGDVAITTNRTRIADFSQPYIESGLVLLAPMEKSNYGTWTFLQPFSLMMWFVTAAFFLIIAVVVWILEHRINDSFRGPPRKQLVTSLWFGFSTMFFKQRENTKSALGRMVLIIWLFVVLIVTSSYTASLTSILTVKNLTPSIKGIESLITSNCRIGFQVGSFVENYLVYELSIVKSRLVPLGSPEEYAHALATGRVAAVIDERPYVDLFLSSFCGFQVVGREFTQSGWGFAFPRESQLTTDLSTAILTLSESGELEKIREKWLKTSACDPPSSQKDHSLLHLNSFSGLFIICGIACFIALLAHFCSILNKFKREFRRESEPSTSSLSFVIQRFVSFAIEKEEESKNPLKRKHSEESPSRDIRHE